MPDLTLFPRPGCGLRSCANCAMRLRREFRVFDAAATGRVSLQQAGLALAAFGEPETPPAAVEALARQAASWGGGQAAPGKPGAEGGVMYEPLVGYWVEKVLADRRAAHAAKQQLPQ